MALPVMEQARRLRQQVVVGKTGPEARRARQFGHEIQQFARELSCCWQDARPRCRPAKAGLGRTLGPKLSCCWQDGAAAVFDPEGAGADGFARPPPGGPGGAASSSPDSGSATSARSRNRIGGIPGQPRGGAVDRPCGAAADRPGRHKPPGRADTSRAGMVSDSNDSADLPSQRCRTVRAAFQTGGSGLMEDDLETGVEYVPHPRRWPFFNANIDGRVAVVLFRR